MNKSGAMELSISTIVVVVLAVMMLIIGSMIINRVGCASIGGVDEMNDKMKQSILDTFRDTNEKITFKERENEVAKGVEYGVGFAIKNTEGLSKDFEYNLFVRDVGSCSFSKEDAENWITLGKSDSFTIGGGNEYISSFMLLIPSETENCKFRYTMSVNSNGKVYQEANVDISIINKPLLKSFC
jgi:hypothetical protein